MSHKKIGNCPGCHIAFNVILGNYQPNPDDISICTNCGQLNVFNNDYSQRKATKQELAELEQQDPEGYSKIMRASVFIKSKEATAKKLSKNN